MERRAPRVSDPESTPQVKPCDRRRFFEDVLQHDVNVRLPAAQLYMEPRRPPINSISSMEVNVDVSELCLDLPDFSDPEEPDEFLSSAGDEGGVASPFMAGDESLTHACRDLQLPGAFEHLSRMSSTSSTSTETCGSDRGEEGAETPVAQSDDEGETDSLLLTETLPSADAQVEAPLGSASVGYRSEGGGALR
ncbi:dysbindin-like [Scleropages formosus]|uniref:Si:ch211-253b8.5 n=1 Tax=Scleropages formosus TaxID=113540 RepID=A0A8C9R1G9_SCLFO|nr:dysbindin-like [Scleropages formosus]